MGIFQAYESIGKGNLGSDEMRYRTDLLADSHNHGFVGTHMDSAADTAYHRHHEHGSGTIKNILTRCQKTTTNFSASIISAAINRVAVEKLSGG